MVVEGHREGQRNGCEDCERTICWVDYVPLGTIAVTWTTRVPRCEWHREQLLCLQVCNVCSVR